MRKYVLGFALHTDHEQILLIRKSRPAWQRGLINGVGGKIKPAELACDAMVREFKEETGLDTDLEAWTYFATLEGEQPDFWCVFCYAAILDIFTALPQTDEPLLYVHSGSPPPDSVPDLAWLIPLAKETIFSPSTAPFAVFDYR